MYHPLLDVLSNSETLGNFGGDLTGNDCLDWLLLFTLYLTIKLKMAMTAENFMVDDHCPLGKNRARTMMSLRIPKHSIIREQNTERTTKQVENN